MSLKIMSLDLQTRPVTITIPGQDPVGELPRPTDQTLTEKATSTAIRGFGWLQEAGRRAASATSELVQKHVISHMTQENAEWAVRETSRSVGGVARAAFGGLVAGARGQKPEQTQDQ